MVPFKIPFKKIFIFKIMKKKKNLNFDFKKNSNFPLIISILGPRKVGKSTLINSFSNYFFGEFNEYSYGPLIILAKENFSYIFIEGLQDKITISNLSKASDIVISVIDTYFGLEIETFEFFSFINSHGTPRIINILTHNDYFSEWKNLKKSKQKIKNRLKKEIGNYIKIFFLSGISLKGHYFSEEISNITRFLTKNEIFLSFIQKIQTYIIITNLHFISKKKRKSVIISGFLKGNSIKIIKNSQGYFAGIGIVEIKNFKKYIESKKKNLYLKKHRTLDQIFLSNQDNRNLYLYSRKNKPISIIPPRFLKYLILIKNNKRKKKKINIFSEKFFYIDSNKIYLKNETFDLKKFQFLNSKILKKSLPINDIIYNSKKNFDNFDISIKNQFNIGNAFFKEKKNFFKNSQYVEIELKKIPNQFSRYFDPTIPLICCIEKVESTQLVLTNGTIFRHKWNKKFIHSNQMIFLSIGWKFILTNVFFFSKKKGKKNIFMKNLKNKLQSSIVFKAPDMKSRTGLIAISEINLNFFSKNRGTFFNILFTGMIFPRKTNLRIYKKIKLKGLVFKTYQKTAFVKNMFLQEMETTRFIGSIIKGEFGEKGIIKKATKFGPSGSFRAIFDRKIHNNSMVYLKIFIPLKFNIKIFDLNFYLMPDDIRELKRIK